ncbi:MAG: Type 1 glutamine amidotransferase-like domain-containing protein [Clostridia bacterium]|nr:Type 1 glutamine amidotransferase-like domain-containing protein [Clostridia bacterium]
MKLILSSCDFRNEASKETILKNLPKPIEDCKLLFIPNEKADSQAINSDLYYNRMAEFGFSKANTYVFDHTKADKFRNLDIDLIYVSGGNTFGTLDKLRKCGFDKEIIEYVKNGVIYIGGSAGAHIATKNIEHVLKYDDNNTGLSDYNGLGLFDGVLICHYDYHRKNDLDTLIANSPYKVYYLTDSDSIVFEC